MTITRLVDIEYRIEAWHGGWTISCGGLPHGRYETRRAALTQALADARHVRRLGCRVRVTVRRPGGSLRSVWADDRTLLRFAAGSPSPGSPEPAGGRDRTAAKGKRAARSSMGPVAAARRRPEPPPAQDRVDRVSDASFPASDPPSWSGAIAGGGAR